MTEASNFHVLVFDGRDDYVDAPHQPTLDLTNSYTIEVWFKADALGGRLVDKGKGGTSLGLTFDTYNSHLRFINQGGLWNSKQTLKTGTWQHAAVTFKNEPDGMKLFIDGKLDSTGTPKAIGTSTNYPVRLGSQADLVGSLFTGKMAEVRLWNCVRTPEEIQATMNQRLVGNESGLVAYWPLDEGSGTTTGDRTKNGNNGKIYSATWTQVTDLPLKSKTTGELQVNTNSDTGFELTNTSSGELAYKLTPSGKWMPAKPELGIPECGPEGFKYLPQEYQSSLKYPNNMAFCLVAVKEKSGEVTELSQETTISLKAGETLRFLVNDFPGQYGDNTGTLTVNWAIAS